MSRGFCRLSHCFTLSHTKIPVCTGQPMKNSHKSFETVSRHLVSEELGGEEVYWKAKPAALVDRLMHNPEIVTLADIMQTFLMHSKSQQGKWGRMALKGLANIETDREARRWWQFVTGRALVY